MREITVAEAIREALSEEMDRNPEVFVFGEDVGLFGGCFGVTAGLYQKYPDRVLDTMIAETGIMGITLGAAYSGMKPVPEIMFSDFITVVMDYLANQSSKNRYMTGMQEGGKDAGFVLRVPNGSGTRAAAQHSQCMEQYLMPIAGLKIAIPSTPYDTKGLLKYAIRGNDPVVFLEHKMLYGLKGPVPEEEYLVPFCSADVKREGKDVTVVATQAMVHKSLAAAKRLEAEGLSIEVVDPRSLKPLDMKTILNSVKKTKHIVVANEAPKTHNALAEIALRVVEEAFDYLEAPPVRVCGPDTPIPFSPVLEDTWTRSEDDIIAGIREVLK
ncbi:MAG: alpha-ketoacid dehydrogenase subunit beta [Synergistaceae bacterium]|jgi:pyruvate dehydrogenase E1 component beta subunit|nr:alpha-ketoacid dehydrogenase subunit beta [Synergistaceae bacterium]